jgi:hypothetical protein
LRRARLDWLNDASKVRNAYPALWAPFVVVGDGAVYHGYFLVIR